MDWRLKYVVHVVQVCQTNKFFSKKTEFSFSLLPHKLPNSHTQMSIYVCFPRLLKDAMLDSQYCYIFTNDVIDAVCNNLTTVETSLESLRTNTDRNSIVTCLYQILKMECKKHKIPIHPTTGRISIRVIAETLAHAMSSKMREICDFDYIAIQ